MDIILRIDNRDFSDRVLTYQVTKEVTYTNVIKTLDGQELYRGKTIRPIVTFSLMPYTDTMALRDYETLSKGLLEVVYTDPDDNYEKVKTMRLVSNLDKIFLLDSINGKRYYKGGKIQLRSTTVD